MSGDLSKEELRFSKSIQELRFLIADPSSGRKSIRKLLSHYRVKPNMIDVVENLSDAQDMIRGKKPHVVFADDSMAGIEAAMGLLQLQQESLEAGEPHAFFLMSSKDSKIMVSGAAEENVDSVLIKPFTFDALTKQLVAVLTDKINPSPYVQSIATGKALAEKGKAKEALQEFMNARSLDPKPALACAQIGLVLQSIARADDAIIAFEEGLSYNPTHFRCLLGLVEALMAKGENEKAYAVGRKLAENHSIPLQKIPDLIKLSIINQQFEDVLGFFDYADAMAKAEKEAAESLSAGLVVCGLHFLKRNNTKGAIDAFRKAEVVTPGNPKVQKRIVVAMIQAGLDAEVKTYMLRVVDEVRNSIEVRLAEFRLFALKESAGKVIEAGRALLQQGTKSVEIYEVMIRKSLELGRSERAMGDLLEAAIRDFPQEEARFRGMLQG